MQSSNSANIVTRDQLIVEHIGLVHHVARKMHRQLSNQASLDDLVSAGTLGLMSAAEAFDPARGAAFSTFALPRIRGAILDDLRDQDNVPRSVRRKARALNAAREAVAQRGAQPAGTREVARELGVDVQTVWEWDAARSGANTVSLDQSSSDDDDAREPWQFAAGDEPVDEAMERREAAEGVRAALTHLPPRDRQLLALYYYEELTQQQIAQVLGVTESRVSQLRSQALTRLRKFMAAPARHAMVA